MIKNVVSKNNMSDFFLVYKGSTNIEEVGTRGVSHLSEHLLATALDDLQDSFQEDCITFNAWTTETEIVFYIRGLEEKVAKYRDVFLERLLKHVPSEEQFEKERNIVLQELYGYFSDQSYSHYLNVLRANFNFYGALGSEKDLENLTYEKYLEFHIKTYAVPSLIINVSKDYVFEYESAFITAVQQKPYEFLYENKVDDNLVTNEFADTRSVICLSRKLVEGDEDIYTMKFISRMLSDGLNSPLLDEVREKRNLVYHISSNVECLNEYQYLFSVLTQTKTDTMFDVRSVIQEVLNAGAVHMTKERYDIVMSMLQTKNKIEQEFTPSYSVITRDSEKSLYDNLDKITFDKVKEIYSKYINESVLEMFND